MKTHFQILIIGGGNAGISLAAQLKRKDRSFDVAVMDPSEKHYYQPAWTLVAGGVFNIENTVRPEAAVIPAGVPWIKEAAQGFAPEQNAVTTREGNRYTYDWLVVAPGIQLDWHKIKGLEGNLGRNGITTNFLFQYAPYTWELLQNLKKGKALFTNPNTPIKCGGAPQKITYLASDYWRKQGVLKDVEVHFYSAGAIIFGVPKYAATLNQVIARYGVRTHFKHNLVEIKADEKVAVFDRYEEGKVVEQVQTPFDMIHITPPQSAPDFVKNSPLAVAGNPLGWVDVDKYTFRHNRYPNIFSIGDASSTPNSKTGAAVRKQVPVLVEQMNSLIKTGQLADARYNGYGSCPLITGYGKLVMAEFDYDNQPVETFPFDQAKERWSMYQLKKQVLPRLYWNAILKGLM
ncbi:MAG: FAD/NAD(P)-binding oxidoreductase [Saprospiraceae bacterium]|nr:FAD/NAD(P)-binding oxidoreductase [Saprospiraceae bacterium]